MRPAHATLWLLGAWLALGCPARTGTPPDGGAPPGATAAAPAAPAAPAAEAVAAPVDAPPPLTEAQTQEALRELGVLLALRTPVAELEPTPAEVERLKQGLRDALLGRPLDPPLAVGGPLVDRLVAERQARASVAFLAKLQGQPGARRLPSGVVIVTQAPGKGEGPGPRDTVRLRYRGTLADGTEFDSSERTGQPATFNVNDVIGCWKEGLRELKPGAKARLGCPSWLAYGPAGSPPGIPPNAPLLFEVELLEVVR
jgi:hypothetical protein